MYEHELSFALGLADRAAEIAMSVYEGDMRVMTKADLTPVTQADIEIEAMVREQISVAFPEDAVYGEEEGAPDRPAERVWIVDPIDATANFTRGIPIWGTLIALQDAGELVLGVVGSPALGERYDAAKGHGARRNGEPIHVSDISSLSEAQVLVAEMADWLDGGPFGASPAVLSMLTKAGRTRGFGDFWGHMLIAKGAAEVMVEPELALWDYAAPTVIVREAGGTVTAMDGSEPRHNGSVVSTNGHLHQEVLRMLASGAGNPEK